jgi:3-hydroxy-3-methylglutaryl CoA synthase
MSDAVGIEKIGVWPCTLSCSIDDICRTRGLDADNFVRRLHCVERSIVGPFEDVVTMAVNAARRVLSDADRASVKLLAVATESSVDDEKPLSSWVHHHLGLGSDCRNFEVKHACYGATGILQVALGWLASRAAPSGAKALVVNTDHSLIGLDGVQEPVLGAGAAAVLLSREPAFAAIEIGKSGVYAHEIADLFRPAPGLETGDADDSLLSYLEGAEMTWDAFAALNPGVRFDQDFAAHVYHLPFGGLAERAHLRLCKRTLGMDRQAAAAHFREKVEPSLVHNKRMGSIYGSATFVAMAGLVETKTSLREGERVSVYAYGSGSCAEWYTMRLGPRAREVAEACRLDTLLGARRRLDVPTYERCERELHATHRVRDHEPDAALVPGHYASHYQGRGHLVLRSVRDYRREYGWS